MDVDTQTQTMIDNLPARTGRSLDAWYTILDAAHVEKHGEAIAFLKGEHAMTHGFANLVVTLYRSRGQEAATAEELISAQYAGAKLWLRPVCDAVVQHAQALGGDVEVAAKKTGVSLRRSRQFALVEAPSAKRVSLGLNLRGHDGTERLRPVSGMCTHRVDLASVDEIDEEVIGWMRQAYEDA